MTAFTDEFRKQLVGEVEVSEGIRMDEIDVAIESLFTRIGYLQREPNGSKRAQGHLAVIDFRLALARKEQARLERAKKA